MQYAAQNIIPSTTELGGKSPNIFFADVMAEDDDVPRQGHRRARALRLQQGRGLHLPVAGADRGVDLRRVHGAGRSSGSPRSARATRSTPTTQIGAQVSTAQLEKIASYVEIGKQEGAELLIGGERSPPRRRARGRLLLRADRLQGHERHADLPGGDLRPGARGDDVPERGARRSRSRTTRCTASAPASGRATRARRSAWAAASRPAACGRTATTSIRRTPPSAATRCPGVGRENHKMMLDHYTPDEVPARLLRPEAARVLLGR